MAAQDFGLQRFPVRLQKAFPAIKKTSKAHAFLCKCQAMQAVKTMCIKYGASNPEFYLSGDQKPYGVLSAP